MKKGLVAVAVMTAMLNPVFGWSAIAATRRVRFSEKLPWMWEYDVDVLGTHKPPPNHYDVNKPPVPLPPFCLLLC